MWFSRHFITLMLCAVALVLISCGREKPGATHLSLPGKPDVPPGKWIDPSTPPGSITGFIVYDPQKNRMITSHNRNRLFIPASTVKVATALTALETLGPDHRFVTTLASTGSVHKGVLEGSLYLVGGGDPELKTVHLNRMISRLKEQGIRRISGNFYFDQGITTPRQEIDKGMDRDKSYNTGISSLSLDFNRLYAWWERESTGKKEKETWNVHLTPQLPGFAISTGGPEKPETVMFHYHENDRNESWQLTSDPPRNEGRTSLPVKHPARFTAGLFRKLCAIRGITLPSPREGKVPKEHGVLVQHTSRPLLDICETFLTYSSNIMSELVLLGTAPRNSSRPSVNTAASWMARHLEEQVQGINWEGFHLENGSGLTSSARVSPEQMLGILTRATGRQWKGRDFISMLPVSGWKWSLVSRLHQPETAFRVWAKTGTINYASALAGKIYTHSGRELLFAFFVTDFERRLDFENSTSKRSRETLRKAYRWQKQHREFMDRVITRWVTEL